MPNACDGRVVPPLAALAAGDGGQVPAGHAGPPARHPRRASAPAAVPLAANCAMALPVVGVGGVPATGVAAVALNITATQADRARLPHRVPVRRGATADVDGELRRRTRTWPTWPRCASAPVGRCASSRCPRWTSWSTCSAGTAPGRPPATPRSRPTRRARHPRRDRRSAASAPAVPAGGTTAFTVAGAAGVPGRRRRRACSTSPPPRRRADGYLTVVPVRRRRAAVVERELPGRARRGQPGGVGHRRRRPGLRELVRRQPRRGRRARLVRAHAPRRATCRSRPAACSTPASPTPCSRARCRPAASSSCRCSARAASRPPA